MLAVAGAPWWALVLASLPGAAALVLQAALPQNSYRVLITDWDPRNGTVDLEQTQVYVDANEWPRLLTVVRHYKIHTRAAAEGQVCTQYPKGRIALEAREDFFRLAMELGIGGRPLPKQGRKAAATKGSV
ncbi:hypothetical protein ABT034_30925 [Streptomyces sp. NPDC002773]|uniref:hypothetical protein n=1 Tax=Streptomyces sp. NPDC002773 TaxID=3154430 RepID=UPI00331AA748